MGTIPMPLIAAMIACLSIATTTLARGPSNQPGYAGRRKVRCDRLNISGFMRFLKRAVLFTTRDYVLLGIFSGLWAALCGWALFFLSQEQSNGTGVNFWFVFGATAIAATVLEIYLDLFKEGYQGLRKRIPGLFVGTLLVAATLEIFVMAIHAFATIMPDDQKRHELLESIFKPQSDTELLGRDATVFFVWWAGVAILFSVAAHYGTFRLLKENQPLNNF